MRGHPEPCVSTQVLNCASWVLICLIKGNLESLFHRRERATAEFTDFTAGIMYFLWLVSGSSECEWGFLFAGFLFLRVANSFLVCDLEP